jgi:hypothetical protein
MPINFDLLTMLLFGNVSYLLLIISMMMTRMLILRIVAIGSGISGGIYDYFWLHDPDGAFLGDDVAGCERVTRLGL